jgi:hypothetical protein
MTVNAKVVWSKLTQPLEPSLRSKIGRGRKHTLMVRNHQGTFHFYHQEQKKGVGNKVIPSFMIGIRLIQFIFPVLEANYG